VTPRTLGARLDDLERAILWPNRVDPADLEAARRDLLAEVDRLGRADGIVLDADPEAALAELNRALAEVMGHRRGRRPR
jgi:hypothetical protein